MILSTVTKVKAPMQTVSLQQTLSPKASKMLTTAVEENESDANLR